MNMPWITELLRSDTLWLVVVLLPLFTACAFLVRRWRATLSIFAAATAVPAFLFALYGQPGGEADFSWLLLGARFGMDATAQVFLFFTALVWLIAGVYAVSYLRDPKQRVRFFVFFLPAMTGNFGLILAEDVSSFYAFFSLMSFAAYGLVAHDRTPYALRAGKVYIWLVVLGEAFVFFGLLLLAGASDSIYFADLPGKLADSGHRDLIIGLLLLGFGIKAGALPLHVWLPLAHPAAPTPASAVLSGAMIKAGLLGWLRFLPLGEMAAPHWGALVMGLGLTAAFYGVVVGLTQGHPKTVLAYSSISQMGMICIAVGVALAVPSAWPYAWGAIMVAATHHALAKGTLFLSVGVASADIRNVGVQGLRFAGLLLPALVLAGLPFTSGADAKLAIKYAAKVAPGMWPVVLSALLPIAAVGTTLLMARFLWLTRPRTVTEPTPPRFGLTMAWLVSVACVLATPLLLRSGLLADVSLPQAAETFPWSGFWPVLAGATVAGLATRLSSRRLWRIPEGDLLVLYLAVLRQIRSALPQRILGILTRDKSASVALWQPHPAGRRLAARLDSVENRIAAWTVFGALLLISMTALFALLSLT